MAREQEGEPVIESTELDPKTGAVERKKQEPGKLAGEPEEWREQK